jgi:hypothetical protein
MCSVSPDALGISFVDRLTYRTGSLALQVWIYHIAWFDFVKVCDGTGEDPLCSRWGFFILFVSSLKLKIPDCVSSLKVLPRALFLLC